MTALPDPPPAAAVPVPSGLLLVDKPAGMTSHSVVYALRNLFGLPRSGKHGPGGRPVTRIGHLGTLDPDATGLLVMALGNAGRVIEYLPAHDKQYRATIRFGLTTDTDDLSGVVQPPAAAPAAPPAWPTRATIEQLLAGEFLGARDQVPPAISAVQIDGKRAHREARAGRPMQMQPRRVVLHAATVERWEPPDLALVLTTSNGYYVRSLARDLGARLHLGGIVAALRRTAVGPWRIEDALPLAAVTPASLDRVLPLYDLIVNRSPAELAAAPQGPQAVRAVSRELGERIVCGQPVELGCERPQGLIWAIHRDTLVAVLRPFSATHFKPRKVFLNIDHYREQFPPESE